MSSGDIILSSLLEGSYFPKVQEVLAASTQHFLSASIFKNLRQQTSLSFRASTWRYRRKHTTGGPTCMIARKNEKKKNFLNVTVD